MSLITSSSITMAWSRLRGIKKEWTYYNFISHKLDEIKRICDRLTILRNGKNMGTYDIGDLTTDQISRLMVGRDIVLTFDLKEPKLKKTALKVRNISVIGSNGKTKVDNVSFDLKEGEILGIAGVEGNGQSELVDVLTGLNKNYGGDYFIYDVDAKI